MKRQLSYIRDGHYIDSNTEDIIAIFVANASDGSTYSIVEIGAKRRKTGGFSQAVHVWSVEAPKAKLSKWQLAQWLGIQLAPFTFLLANAAHLLVVLLTTQVIQALI
jgi:hypothetical protein